MRPRRTDANHASVADSLRGVGAYVKSLHELPGALDLLVAFRGCLTILEVKDGRKKPSDRRATSAERETLRNLLGAGCPAWIVEDETEALVMIGAVEDQARRALVMERTHQECAR